MSTEATPVFENVTQYIDYHIKERNRLQDFLIYIKIQ